MYKEHKDVSSEESSISNMQEIEAILNALERRGPID